jgi:hypothetical protein
MWLLAGAPYYEPAKEREGAPSLFPRCSCPFFIIFPSIFVAALMDAPPQFWRIMPSTDQPVKMGLN